MIKIGTVTVGAGGAANIAFTSIPQTYTDLVLMLNARSTNTGTSDNVTVTLNVGTLNNMTYFEQSSATTATGTGGTTGIARITGGGAIGWGSVTFTIQNYTTAAARKLVTADYVAEQYATAGPVGFYAGITSSAVAATTSVTLATTTGNNFAQYSTATLYGIVAGTDNITTAAVA